MRREINLQGNSGFNGLQNMLFLVSSLAQAAKEQMTVLSRFGVHICMTLWVEVNGNKVYMSRATFSWRFLHSSILYFKNVPPLVIFGPLLRNPGDGTDCSKCYCD